MDERCASTWFFRGSVLRRAVLFVGASMVVVVLCGVSLTVWLLYQSEVESWKRQTSTLSYNVSEQMDLMMSAAELVLNGVAKEVRERRAPDADAFRALLASKPIFEALREKSEGVPGIEVVALVADNGDTINFSRYYPAADINISERDYFQAHRADPGLGLFISRPVRNKSNGRWTFTLSRRLSDDQGRFMGIVLVGLSAEHVEASFKDSARLLGDGVSVSLYRKDRMLLARYPENDPAIGGFNEHGGTSLILKDPTAQSGLVTVNSPYLAQKGNVRRIVAVEKLRRYPLAVTVAVADGLYLSSWRPALYFILAAGLGSMAATTLPLVFILRVLRQREADVAELARLNNDIMERQVIQDRLAHDASHDELTGLPRRSLFLDRMEQALLKAARYGTQVGVIFLDLDRFKTINDTLGHQAGDELLRQVAARLQAGLRQVDTVARFGGDEFVVLLSEGADRRKFLVVAEKLRAALAEPFELAGRFEQVSVSLGLAAYPGDGYGAEELLKLADQRMYQAKSQGRNRVRAWDEV